MVAGPIGPTIIALADDHEPADGSAVLDFWQAQDKARLLVRGKDAAGGDRPATVAEALDVYERDLAARNGAVANARNVRNLLPASLLARPVALLSVKELRRWRDGLLDGRQASTVNRTFKSFKAALNLAAAHDLRITNARFGGSPWRACPTRTPLAMSDCPSRTCAPSSAAAYAVDPALGLWVEVAATTGARPSQIARLDVADLQDERVDPRLMMPSSLKGKGRKRITRVPVPIPASLAAKLRRAAAGRAPDAPLLHKPNGTRWQHADHIKPFAQAAIRAGLAGPRRMHCAILQSSARCWRTYRSASLQLHTIRASRSSERNYASYILDHSDLVSRRALLDLAAESQS